MCKTVVSFPKQNRIVLKGKARLKLKFKVHKRDNFTCINPACRCKVDATLPSINYVLSMHHVKRKSQMGDDTVENTASICLLCHDLIHDEKLDDGFCVDYLERLYGEGEI